MIRRRFLMLLGVAPVAAAIAADNILDLRDYAAVQDWLERRVGWRPLPFLGSVADRTREFCQFSLQADSSTWWGADVGCLNRFVTVRRISGPFYRASILDAPQA